MTARVRDLEYRVHKLEQEVTELKAVLNVVAWKTDEVRKKVHER